MMPSEVRQYLAAYADGELAVDARREIAQHLAGSPEARAEVLRWQQLRACARRAVFSEPVPPGLRENVLADLRATARSFRIRRWGTIGLLSAAAAALVIGIFWRPSREVESRAVPIPVVPAGDLARIHRRCAVERRHDPFGLAGRSRESTQEAMRERPEVGFPADVPDFSDAGLMLAGVCACRPIEGLHTVHAYYKRRDAGTGDLTEAERTVSFFAMAHRIELGGRIQPMCSQNGRKTEGRTFVVAVADGGLTVLKWDNCAYSFALCSKLPQEQLMHIAGTMKLAWGPALQPPAVAASWARPTPAAAGLLGVLVLAGSLYLPRRSAA